MDIVSIFKQGEVVTLKSGGPEMTIDKVDLRRKSSTATAVQFEVIYHCIWFEGKNIKKDVFSEDSVELPENDVVYATFQ